MARIIVVHEIAANHRRVRESLSEHEILAFKKIATAMRFVAKNRADLIICAVHLKEGDVFDFLHWVKADEKLSSIPFVFFCAEPTELAKYVRAGIKNAAHILGASRYIAMDEFDSSAFRRIIDDVLGAAPHVMTDQQLRALRLWAADRHQTIPIMGYE